MRLFHNIYFLLPISFALFILSACCDPAQRKSFPTVIQTSYTDTAVKDAIDLSIQGFPPPDPLDSGYYPIYSLDIQNTGTEDDNFTLSYTRIKNGFIDSLNVQQFVKAGETKTFKTYGPIPSNSPDSAKALHYYTFYVKTLDSIALSVMLPTMNIHYGESPNGPEQCGSPGKDISVDPTKLKHK
jgi:hypothetical protein